MSNDYADLKRRIIQAGLLERRPAAATGLIALNLGLFALCIAIFALVRNPWVQLLNAAFLSFISGQWGFVMHEAGHRQMFKRGWLNVTVGMLHANLLLGISYSTLR